MPFESVAEGDPDATEHDSSDVPYHVISNIEDSFEIILDTSSTSTHLAKKWGEKQEKKLVFVSSSFFY